MSASAPGHRRNINHLLVVHGDRVLVELRTLPAKLQAELGGYSLDERAHRILLACRDDVIFGLRLLQHEPLRADVVARVAPVAARVEIAQVQAIV